MVDPRAGTTRGPAFVDDGAVYSFVAYRPEADSLGGGELTEAERSAQEVGGWPLGGTMQTVPDMPIDRHGPVWMTGQGT
eukprot:SAG22_NODE_6599_length_833_cov_1.068120_1_plen_78_part_10